MKGEWGQLEGLVQCLIALGTHHAVGVHGDCESHTHTQSCLIVVHVTQIKI